MGPAPELGHRRVEEHSPVEVVAVGTQRLSEKRVVIVVASGADEGPPVRTAGAGRATAAIRPAPVHRAEGRRRQSEKHCRALGHVLAHALSTPQAARHEVEGIGAVERRARRAQRLPAGPAGLEEHPVRESVGVEHGAARCVCGPASKAHGPAAATHPEDLVPESLLTARGTETGEDPGDRVLVPMLEDGGELRGGRHGRNRAGDPLT